MKQYTVYHEFKSNMLFYINLIACDGELLLRWGSRWYSE